MKSSKVNKFKLIKKFRFMSTFLYFGSIIIKEARTKLDTF